MSPAQKQKKYRQRQRRREIVLRVAVAHDKIVDALVASERLNESDVFDRTKLESASADVLMEWSRRWRNIRYR
jgi:hypothetical protein